MKISYDKNRIIKKKKFINIFISITMLLISLLLSITVRNINNNVNIVVETFRIVGKGVLENASIEDTASEVFECINESSENDLIEVFKSNAEKFND